MKKFSPYVHYLAAFAGVAAALLRQWLLVVGPDRKGLYPAAHPGWIGYLVVVVLAIAVLFLLTRSDQTPTRPFAPAAFSIFGQAGAACGIGLFCLPLLQGSRMELICALVGFAAAIGLLVLSWQQFQQRTVFAPAYLLPAVFFALQVFLMGRAHSTETQMLCFLPQFLACAATGLASYEMMGLVMGIGNQRKGRFLRLCAAALCFAATPGAHWMYAVVGLWQLLGPAFVAAPIAPAEAQSE